MNYLNKLERKFGRYAIPNLSKWLIFGYAVGYMLYYMEMFTSLPILEFLMLDPAKVMHGQIWRLVTWVLMPPSYSNIFFYIIMMLLYYQLGTALERTWGTFRYNAYIFGGIIFTAVGVMAAFSCCVPSVWQRRTQWVTRSAPIISTCPSFWHLPCAIRRCSLCCILSFR